MAGPVVVDEEALWYDASTGKRRLLAAVRSDREPKVLLEDNASWSLLHSPRPVISKEGRELILIPASPKSKILKRDRESWREVMGELPEWATSAAVDKGWLYLIGSVEGAIKYTKRPWAPSADKN